jgi:hypothetical protein
MITSIYEFANSIKPKNITLISIRSTQNSFGTGDQTLYIEKDIRKKLENEYGAWYKCYNEENKEVNNKKYNFYSVSIAPRSSFRNEFELSKEKIQAFIQR